MDGQFPASGYTEVLLDTDYLCLVVSPQHPFAGRAQVSLDELKREKLILRSRAAGTRLLFDNYLYNQSENIKNFHVIMEVDNVAMIKDLVSQDLGVSIIAKSACREEERAGRLVAVPIENASMSRNIQLVYHGDFSHPDVLEELRAIYNRIR